MIKLIKSRGSLFNASLILFISMNLGNAFNYFFQFFMSRFLTKTEFGEMNSLLSLYMILVLPISALTLAFSRELAAFGAFSKNEIRNAISRRYLRWISFPAAAVFIAGLVLSPLTARFLKMVSIAPVIITILAVSAAYYYMLGAGYLQGMQLFVSLGIIYALSPLLKILSGILLVKMGFGIAGAMTGVFISVFVFIIFMLYKMLFIGGSDICNKKAEEGMNSAAGFGSLKSSFYILFIYLAYYWLLNLDMIFVKHRFSPEEAGIFSAVVVLGKIVLSLPYSIVIALFPIVAEQSSEKRNSSAILWKAVAYTVAISSAGVIAFYLLPDLMLVMLFGQKYSIAAGMLGIEGVAMLLYAVLNVLITYNIARGHYWTAGPLVAGVIIQLSGFYLLSRLPENIIYVNALSAFAVIVIISVGMKVVSVRNPIPVIG